MHKTFSSIVTLSLLFSLCLSPSLAQSLPVPVLNCLSNVWLSIYLWGNAGSEQTVSALSQWTLPEEQRLYLTTSYSTSFIYQTRSVIQQLSGWLLINSYHCLFVSMDGLLNKAARHRQHRCLTRWPERDEKLMKRWKIIRETRKIAKDDKTTSFEGIFVSLLVWSPKTMVVHHCFS